MRGDDVLQRRRDEDRTFQLEQILVGDAFAAGPAGQAAMAFDPLGRVVEVEAFGMVDPAGDVADPGDPHPVAE